jgi:hypothetical protein
MKLLDPTKPVRGTTAKKRPDETRTIPEAWVPPSRASPTPPAQISGVKQRSKLTDSIIHGILSLFDTGVPGRQIQKRYYPFLSHTTILNVIVARGRPPSRIELLRLMRARKEQDTLERQTRNLGMEIESYQPTLRSSFNGGLGGESLAPKSVLIPILNANKKDKTPGSFYEDRSTLLSMLNPKQLSPTENGFRQMFKQTWEKLGHDAASDNDFDFGLFDSVAGVGLAVIRANPSMKINNRKLAFAAIYFARPNWRERLEQTAWSLRCGRCRKLRSFIRGKEPDTVICTGCGLPVKKPRLKIRRNIIDQDYLTLIQRTVESKSRGSPGPIQVPDGRAEPPQDTFQSRSRAGLEPERPHDKPAHEVRENVRSKPSPCNTLGVESPNKLCSSAQIRAREGVNRD